MTSKQEMINKGLRILADAIVGKTWCEAGHPEGVSAQMAREYAHQAIYAIRAMPDFDKSIDVTYCFNLVFLRANKDFWLDQVGNYQKSEPACCLKPENTWEKVKDKYIAERVGATQVFPVTRSLEEVYAKLEVIELLLKEKL